MVMKKKLSLIDLVKREQALKRLIPYLRLLLQLEAISLVEIGYQMGSFIHSKVGASKELLSILSMMFLSI